MKRIPLSVPNLSGNAMKYVREAIETEWVSTGGAFIDEFESKVSEMNGAYCVACQSGTAAIHLSLVMAGVKRDEYVIAPTLTFIAAINPIHYLGANPIFFDCDDSLTLDAKKLEGFLASCEKRTDGTYYEGKRIGAIVVVHVFGNLGDMDSIMKLSTEYMIPVVEDATEALGSFDEKGRMAGTIAHFGAYSFNGNKIITTGGGGMIVTKDEEMAKRARYLSTQAKDDPLYYRHEDVGFNYRMTNLQAALGLSQMEVLPGFLETKRGNYELYQRELDGVEGLRLLPFREGTSPNYWFYALYIESSFPYSRDELLLELKARGIETRPIWGLIHEQTPYKDALHIDIEKAKDYYEHVLNLPCSTNLTKEDLLTVTEALKELSHDR